MKNFKPFLEPEDYMELEDSITNPYYEEELYQELEDEIVEEDSFDFGDYLGPLNPTPMRINYPPIDECCKSCSNHPSNGGTGFCNCTLPSGSHIPPCYPQSKASFSESPYFWSELETARNSSRIIIDPGDGSLKEEWDLD